jgi:hypothetical protein
LRPVSSSDRGLLVVTVTHPSKRAAGLLRRVHSRVGIMRIWSRDLAMKKSISRYKEPGRGDAGFFARSKARSASLHSGALRRFQHWYIRSVSSITLQPFERCAAGGNIMYLPLPDAGSAKSSGCCQVGGARRARYAVDPAIRHLRSRARRSRKHMRPIRFAIPRDLPRQTYFLQHATFQPRRGACCGSRE